jgi:hypothetical protein
MSSSERPKVAFLAGVLTASTLWLLTLGFAGYRVGFGTFLQTIWTKVIAPTNKVLDLPRQLLPELIALRAVVDNADNPTQQLQHYTTLVQRDDELGWALIPNVRITLHVLRSLRPMNLDPPVLALPSDATVSESLRKYISRQARLS